MIELAKNQLDVGLLTANPTVIDFWQETAGLEFDHLLKIGPGHDQHRFVERGSVIKVNLVGSLPGDQRSGLEELLIARDDLSAPRTLEDPDGNRVTFLPAGREGVTQVGVRMAVPDRARTMAYYRDALGFVQEAPDRVRLGDSVLIFEERASAPTGFAQAERGWLYLTVQVHHCDEEVAAIEATGGEVVVTPRNLGEVARMAMIRDPDGNLLEVSQRASLTGPLPTDPN